MVNKIALINKIQEVDNCSFAQAERILDTVLNTIKNEVKNAGKVSIGGFGIFKSAKVKARDARNPKTGEKVKVVAHNKVKFTAGKALKEFVK